MAGGPSLKACLNLIPVDNQNRLNDNLADGERNILARIATSITADWVVVANSLPGITAGDIRDIDHDKPSLQQKK